MQEVKIRPLVLLTSPDKTQLYLAEGKIGMYTGILKGFSGLFDSQRDQLPTALHQICQEQAGITPGELVQVAINYYALDGYPVSTVVPVFLTNEFIGELQETRRLLQAQPYTVSDLPWDKMFLEDKEWLPRVFDGQFVNCTFAVDAPRATRYRVDRLEACPLEEMVTRSRELLS
jgi:hypothetical protein